jgi:hypothetical protein
MLKRAAEADRGDRGISALTEILKNPGADPAGASSIA